MTEATKQQTGLTEDGKKIATAIEKLAMAIRDDERVACGRSRGKAANSEKACRKRFRQLWKAIRDRGDCYLGDAEDSEVDFLVRIY